MLVCVRAPCALFIRIFQHENAPGPAALPARALIPVLLAAHALALSARTLMPLLAAYGLVKDLTG